MPYTVGDFYKALDKIACFGTAEDWDNAGLLVGSENMPVTSVLVALDATFDVLREAQLLGVNLIITHHPVIFPSIKRIDGESLLYALISANIAVISAHTNFDSAENGVNDALCACLSLKNVRALESASLGSLGRIGELQSPMSPEALAAYVKERLHAGSVRFTSGKTIATAAVCGGSGAELWRDAHAHGAQALITSEAKHHQLIEACQYGFTLIDAGHYATEAVSIKPLAERLVSIFPDVPVTASASQSDPACHL